VYDQVVVKKHKKNKEMEEEHKKNVLHVETLTLMCKYQFIFMRLDTTLRGWNKAVDTIERSDLIKDGFNRLKEHSSSLEKA
jgi:transposase